MGVFDKFLNIMKLDEEDDFDEFDEYDEEDECYYCSVNMDEDDMMRFLASPHSQCPFFHIYDEYKIVRKQN